jgi:hypothetical protein
MAFLNTLSTSYLSVSRSSLGTGAALDEFGQNALFGYSLRKVRDDAYKCIRVVRGDGDNVEQDIGFTSDGIVDIEAITTFAQGFPCYVKLWYNQVLPEGTLHLGSTVEAQQPLIAGNSDHIWQDMEEYWYNSYDTYGYVYIDPSNNLPYIYFGEGRYFQFVETGGNYADSSGWSTELTNLNDDYSVFFLGQSDRFGGTANILVGNGGSDRVNLTDNSSVYSVNGTGATISLSDGFNKPYVWEIERNGSNNLSLYRNNTNLITSTTTAAGEFSIDKVGEFFNGDVFEILGYSATQVERDDLYDNIDEHYGIESYTSLAAVYADVFLSRVEVDGGTMESPSCLAKDLSPMLNDDEPQ